MVELNNEYRELQLSERDEERRILQALSEELGAFSYEIATLIEIITEIDLVLAKANMLRRSMPWNQTGHVPQKGHRSKMAVHPGSVIRLYDARHPLLDPDTVVPVDVD